MSDLLNSASLVMIPSGYKEDIVYSEVPTDGSGDLSFTRASNGTRINSAGLVEVVPWNLAQQSETIGVSPWVAQNTTVTTNATTAPNGTSTAEKIIENTSNGYHQVYQEIFASGSVVGQDYTFSCYAKASERTKISLALQTPDVSIGTFDLINGTASISGLGGVAIDSVGNGWYRCSIYRVNTNTGYIYGNLQMNDGTGTVYTGDGTSGTFVWGAQVNIGSTAKPYFPTTDRLNVPRLTYQNGGGGCPSLLLEKHSTNLVTYSEQFDDASWLNNGTITANATTSPDGTQNADLFYAATGSVKRVYKTATITSSTVYSVSIFAKASGKNFIFITDIDNSNEIWFNLSNGTFTSPIVGTASMVDYGNGWYKCSYNTTSSTTTGYAYYGVSDTSGSFTFTANGTDGIYLWGAQIEASSYPTSYIPTTSASATRVADNCKKTGISSLFGTNQGTFFMDFLFNNTGLYDYLFDVTDSSNTQRFLMYDDSGSGLFVFYDSQNSVSSTMQLTQGQRYKIGVKYNSSGTIWYVNGILKATGTASFAYQMSQIYLGQRFSIEDQTQIQVNQTIVFPTALSGTDLIALTTI